MKSHGERREPERTCVVCRRASSRSALIRVVRSPDGAVGVDPDGKGAGRGAYVCRDRSCRDKAPNRLAAALRAGRIDEEQVRKDLATVGVG